MPNKATVSGIMQDATLAPVQGGKVVATLQGSDTFDNGVRVVTRPVEATTAANGAWSLDLIVNGEGEAGSTTWNIELFNEYAISVHKITGLFIATDTAITLGDLEKVSAANKTAATMAGKVRLIVVTNYAEYEALPPNQKRADDVILVSGV